MSTWDRASHYYRGNGVVMIASRDSAGKPKGFTPVGNCNALNISIETSVIEHKESQSGQNAIDLRVETEKKAKLSVTLENFDADVLETALRGTATRKAAGSVTGEALTLYNGKILSLANIKVSSVVVKRGAQALTAYVNDATPYDYKLNADAGSIQLNDGSVVAVDKLTTGGTAPSAITVGATTQVTVANSAAVGDYVVFTGFSGADAALINGKAFKILTASASAVTIDLDTTGKTITLGTPLSAFDGVALTADYSYAAQNKLDALTVGSLEKWLRFEGLNTADGNNPVVVDVFKFLLDPTKELSLITDGDNIAQFVLEGNVLADPLQASGSQFFRQVQVR
jgi:hypothetical protein